MARNNSLDILRILSALAVVSIHLGVDRYVGWSVPVFFMMSGAFLLSSKSDVPMMEFYRTRVPRILIPLVFWNIVYVLAIYASQYLGVQKQFFQSWPRLLLSVLDYGAWGHLWFLYALLGFYLLTPFLRKMFKDCGRGEALVLFGILFLVQIRCFFVRTRLCC